MVEENLNKKRSFFFSKPVDFWKATQADRKKQEEELGVTKERNDQPLWKKMRKFRLVLLAGGGFVFGLGVRKNGRLTVVKGKSCCCCCC